MTTEQPLLKKINGQLQVFTQISHQVFRNLAEACDLFAKGDKVKVNSLASNSAQVVLGELAALKHSIIREVAKSYSILPVSSEHIRVCVLLWDACYRAARIIRQLGTIAGKHWVEETTFYDNLGPISSCILQEFEALLEGQAAMGHSREKASKIIDEANAQFDQVARYIEAMDKMVLNELEKAPSLVILKEVLNGFEDIAEKILESSELVLAISSADSALE